MRHSRRAIPPLLLTLLLLTACASGQPSRLSDAHLPSSAALSPLLVAVRQTLDQPAAFRVRLTGGSLLGPGVTTVTGSGAFDFRAQRGKLTLAGGRGGPGARAIYTPRVVYVRPRSPMGFLPPGRSWLAIDVANAATLVRNFPQIAGQVDAVDPDLTLRELAWGAVSTGDSSAAVLGGRHVRRVDVMVDLNRALRQVSGPSRGAYTAALESELAALKGEDGHAGPVIAVHAFLTQEGQLLGVELVPPGAGAGGVSMTFGDAGVRVDAGPPPASSVADLSAITPSGERENQNGGDADGG